MEGRREEENKKRKVWRRGGWIIGSSFYVACGTNHIVLD